MHAKHKVRKTATTGTLPHHDDHQAARLLMMLRSTRNCRRCGGLLVAERIDGAIDMLFEGQVSALRCIQCGDILDHVILRNRMDPTIVEGTESEDMPWIEDPIAASSGVHAVESA
ncbi:MAG: hypothetical protein JNN16_06870 [Nitrospira sp.]|nr:hypothetical protein [Nitrospira sp.]MBS0166950.1 hypothetical protein [Nitrospira sp.]